MLVARLTKARVGNYLIQHSVIISVVLVSSLLIPLLFPSLLSSGGTTTLVVKPSNSLVELRHPFTSTGALTSNGIATTEQDTRIQQPTSSQTPFAATKTRADVAYDYMASESTDAVHWYKAVHDGNFSSARKSNVKNIVAGNMPTPAPIPSSWSRVKNQTRLSISAKPNNVPLGETFNITGTLIRIQRGKFPVPANKAAVPYQTIYLNTYQSDNTTLQISNTTTDKYGFYNFTLKAETPGIHTYYTNYKNNSRDYGTQSEDVTVIVSPHVESQIESNASGSSTLQIEPLWSHTYYTNYKGNSSVNPTYSNVVTIIASPAKVTSYCNTLFTTKPVTLNSKFQRVGNGR